MSDDEKTYPYCQCDCCRRNEAQTKQDRSDLQLAIERHVRLADEHALVLKRVEKLESSIRNASVDRAILRRQATQIDNLAAELNRREETIARLTEEKLRALAGRAILRENHRRALEELEDAVTILEKELSKSKE